VTKAAKPASGSGLVTRILQRAPWTSLRAYQSCCMGSDGLERTLAIQAEAGLPGDLPN
jgi:hypothetical protein